MIICGYGGIGKSYVADQPGLADIDSSLFHPVRDHLGAYLQAITEAVHQGLVPMVSTHPEVVMGCADISRTLLVIPDISDKAAYLARYAARQSPEAFIQLMDSHWESFIRGLLALRHPKLRILILAPGMTLGQALAEAGSPQGLWLRGAVTQEPTPPVNNDAQLEQRARQQTRALLARLGGQVPLSERQREQALRQFAAQRGWPITPGQAQDLLRASRETQPGELLRLARAVLAARVSSSREHRAAELLVMAAVSLAVPGVSRIPQNREWARLRRTA